MTARDLDAHYCIAYAMGASPVWLSQACSQASDATAGLGPEHAAAPRPSD
jgi:hypothetical protein